MFFHSFSHNAHTKKLACDCILWKKHPKSNQNIANHRTTCQLKAIFHVLKLYSTNQIPFCLNRFPFITCNFLVNNLHFMMYSKCIIQHHWKISYQTLYYWTKSAFSYLGLNPITWQFLVNNLQINNQTRNLLWNIILFFTHLRSQLVFAWVLIEIQ